VVDSAGHSGTIVGLRFSPDDRQLVSVGIDGLVLVWNLYA
jgi:WD40 repeat protein